MAISYPPEDIPAQTRTRVRRTARIVIDTQLGLAPQIAIKREELSLVNGVFDSLIGRSDLIPVFGEVVNDTVTVEGITVSVAQVYEILAAFIDKWDAAALAAAGDPPPAP